jgi:hypothetical protein
MKRSLRIPNAALARRSVSGVLGSSWAAVDNMTGGKGVEVESAHTTDL